MMKTLPSTQQAVVDNSSQERTDNSQGR